MFRKLHRSAFKIKYTLDIFLFFRTFLKTVFFYFEQRISFTFYITFLSTQLSYKTQLRPRQNSSHVGDDAAGERRPGVPVGDAVRVLAPPEVVLGGGDGDRPPDDALRPPGEGHQPVHQVDGGGAVRARLHVPQVAGVPQGVARAPVLGLPRAQVVVNRGGTSERRGNCWEERDGVFAILWCYKAVSSVLFDDLKVFFCFFLYTINNYFCCH